jgi:predicted ATP-dependent endonuclease of OLD family
MVRAEVLRACALIAEAATRLAPEFIRPRYSFELTARAARVLAEKRPIEIAAHELMPTAPVPRVPLFVVDEPERHLHRRAQRQLARWLADLVRVHDTQALGITHSVAFVAQADTTAYVSRNPPDNAVLQPCRVDGQGCGPARQSRPPRD